MWAAASLLVVSCVALPAMTEAQLRKRLEAGKVTLPPGVITVRAPIALPDGAVLRGRGTVLRMSSRFRGPALLLCRGVRGIRIEAIQIDGNRAALARPQSIPPWDQTFAATFAANAILIEDSAGVEVRRISFRRLASFAVLASRSRDVTIEDATIEDSGSRNAKGRNNTTGGVLVEDGSSGFTVRRCTFRRVLGNGVWTHSRGDRPRNRGGLIEANRFEEIGRDAIQVGHATRVVVRGNTGARIGYPDDAVDIESLAIPVAIDTSGNVDETIYEQNRFEEINGKCIDLDGFHDGAVRDNVCVTRNIGRYSQYGIVFNNTNPGMQSRNVRVERNTVEGMQFGGVFVIGSGHTISGNRFSRLNQARCMGCRAEQPRLLDAGIYLGARAEHPAPAEGNTIANNVVAGFGMGGNCIVAAPGVDLTANTIRDNECRNE